MERDLSNPKNILFADGNALKTTDGQTTTTIVGSSREPGYSNLRGKQARFKHITSFLQLDARRIVVVDKRSYCLRLVDRVSQTVEPLAGKCEQGYGFRDGIGSNAMFSLPMPQSARDACRPPTEHHCKQSETNLALYRILQKDTSCHGEFRVARSDKLPRLWIRRSKFGRVGSWLVGV